MGLVFRNTAAVVALLVVFHVANALPANKGGKDKDKGKGKDSLVEDDSFSSLQNAFAEAQAEDETADFILADQEREKRDAEEPAALLPVDSASEDAALAGGKGKKPCGGNKNRSQGGDDSGTDGAEGEAANMENKKKRGKGKGKKRGSKGGETESVTEEASKLESLFMDTELEGW